MGGKRVERKNNDEKERRVKIWLEGKKVRRKKYGKERKSWKEGKED